MDDAIGFTEINMLPLLRLPKSTSERWHRITPNGPEDKWKATAMILLSITFTPTKSLPAIQQATQTLSFTQPYLQRTSAGSDLVVDGPPEPAFTDHLFKLHVSHIRITCKKGMVVICGCMVV